MQAKSPNFFYLMDLNMEGQLRNVLWADARSRSASQYFGDVVSFDTTYLKYKFNVPLVLFVGTNHHGQSILLGCGLISEQVVENYIWLFKAWLTCTLGSAPNGIITDESKVTKAAVSEVFPKTRHRVCLWRMMKSIKEKLKEYTDYRSIKKALGKVVFESSLVDEFEENWSRLINAFGLEGNEFFSSLFEARNSWVPAFLKDTFWANMSITCYKERINSFFEGHVHPETSLKNFFSMYEEVLSSKYETELQADYESFHKTGMFVTKFHMEEQMSKLYTFNMFKVFQDELKLSACCQASLVKVDAAISTFKVRECSIVSDADRTENKNYHVSYNVEGSLVHCSCGFFSLGDSM
ncbi:hypothetical protein HPP92_001594 [Vanilla planifolia]|uniref:Protein FAR1-RELATED SEQUENCE n=1 Tax=Vanilla planifolia TaxID=51239 RepID=A0A835SC84_VANPL|nr:hypothetical protein HPP92_001594 [Vanilla planifolia]